MMPHTEMPWYSEALATARIAAFMPGASPDVYKRQAGVLSGEWRYEQLPLGL